MITCTWQVHPAPSNPAYASWTSSNTLPPSNPLLLEHEPCSISLQPAHSHKRYQLEVYLQLSVLGPPIYRVWYRNLMGFIGRLSPSSFRGPIYDATCQIHQLFKLRPGRMRRMRTIPWTTGDPVCLSLSI